jgi:uncharacterized MAPEG superfamily protein
MSTPLVCLVGFTLWAIVLVTSIGTVRSLLVLAGKKRPNQFPGGTEHGGDRYWRLNRAHLNTLENLPIFATLVLGGTILHVRAPAFVTLSEVVLGARVLQSIFHISSGSSTAVMLRFSMFVVQLVCFAWLGCLVLRAAL